MIGRPNFGSAARLDFLALKEARRVASPRRATTPPGQSEITHGCWRLVIER